MTKPNGWEDKLDELQKRMDEYTNGSCPMCGIKPKEIKNLISQAILSAKENLLREIMEEMPKEKDIVYANGDLRELANYHEKIGFNNHHDQVNTILERKLSTVKKI